MSYSPDSDQKATTAKEDDQPAYLAPAKGDFKLTVKTLSKECFGSAGCSLTFRVRLAHDNSAGPLDPDKALRAHLQDPRR